MEEAVQLLSDLFIAELDLYAQYRISTDFYTTRYRDTLDEHDKNMAEKYQEMAAEVRQTLIRKYTKALEN